MPGTIERMRAEGVELRVNQHIGVNVAAKKRVAEFDALVLAGWCRKPARFAGAGTRAHGRPPRGQTPMLLLDKPNS